MLTIQRASAGSGKTYALAKKFILNLIAFKSEGNEWSLRNERQIDDALRHILAITFTNKATNEMKQRIVNNLSLLARAANSEIDGNLLATTPYLEEFHSLLKVDYRKIGKAAAYALRSILNNYSLFKISTIDSFFQELLRTFAYEANLNDSYQLEIDSTYITEAALDSAMHELDSHPEKMGMAALWFKVLMKEEAKKNQGWNLFNKKASAGSIYSRIRNSLAQLEREDFKEVKDSIDSYFSDRQKVSNLPKLYFSLRDRATIERDNLLKEIKRYAAGIESMIRANDCAHQIKSNFIKQLEKISQLEKQKNSLKFDSYLNTGSVFNKKYQTPGNSIDAEAMQMYALLTQWYNPSPDSYYKNWKIYGELMPYLGLIIEVKTFLAQVLETNNLIQLSDTGYILQKVIGDEDAPFIYERLGSRIDHFLIDEFQDTSRMQWQIIYPLLNEGVSKDKDSLIIGDPKQSIYRFRNADHRLITQVVPMSFRNHLAAGYSIEENTNWRSHTNIVDFNNNFFKSLAEEITLQSATFGGGTDFNELYSNVMQHAHNQEGKGYVEIRIFSKTDDDDEEDNDILPESDERDGWFENKSLMNIGPLLSSLIERGYSQKDICILVNTNERGKMVVETLLAYNDSIGEGNPVIDFISEESMLISSSPAIAVILGVLEKLANPSIGLKKDEDVEGNKTKYYDWNKIKSDYNIFCKQHQKKNPVERLLLFLDEGNSTNSLFALLENLAAPTLSAVTELIIKTFLDEKTRKAETLFIASFQDLVTEYSASYPDDVALFLEWWKAKGSRASIASPENVDAVQIMTIHKSKGLEFKCVIVPFATDSFKPSTHKEEWRWVQPYVLDGLEMPPVLPVKTSAILKGSVHEKDYNEYYDQVLTDKINMYYVAFTRAKNELYIFTKETTRSDKSISEFLVRLNKEDETEHNYVITFGSQLSLTEILKEKETEKLKEAEKSTLHYLDDYYVNNRQPKLLSRAVKVLPSGEFTDLA